MQFRLKNISNKNHRVTMRTVSGEDQFDQNGPEPGDVILENNNMTLNACLAGVAGPVFSCAGSLPTAVFTDVNGFNGKLYLNGIEYDFNVPGNTFIEKYRTLAANNMDLDSLMEVTDDGLGRVVFTALNPEPLKFALVADIDEQVNWKQPISETQNNASIEITDTQVTFCLLERVSFDINKSDTLFTDISSFISLQMFPNNPILLDNTNVRLSIVEGDAEIANNEMYENNASWNVTAKAVGTIKLELYCPYLVPEYTVFEIEAKEMPIMELSTPGLFDWNIRNKSVDFSTVDQVFSDGFTISAAQMRYAVTTKTTLPPFYSKPVSLVGKSVQFNSIGNSELVGRAYHPALNSVVNSVPKLINVFRIPDAMNLGTLIPGSYRDVQLALEGTTTLPDGWTTRLVKRSPVDDVLTMVEWSIDPEDPLHVMFKVIGGTYSNNIVLGVEFVNPDGVAGGTVDLTFRIDTTYDGSQALFLTYPNDDSNRKDIDISGIVYGAKFGGAVTIETFDFEMDTVPVKTYQTVMDDKCHFNFRLPEDAFSPDPRRATIRVTSEKWDGDEISSMNYAKPRLPLVVKCERNVPLATSATAARRDILRVVIDDEITINPLSDGRINIDLTSTKTDLATLKIYAENAWKGTPNLGTRFYRLKTGTSSDADTENPSIREIVSFGDIIDSSTVTELQFDSISGLTAVPSSIPAEWKSTESLFKGCKDLNDPNIKLWNVVNITNMNNMFNKCTAFTQDLSGWCVSSIGSEPTGFATDSGLTPTLKPVWGTCPNG